MKVNLLIGNSSPVLNGYLNIDCCGNPQSSDRIVGQIENLEALVDANECEELIALQVLDHMPIQIRAKVLQHYLTRIAHGGLLIISSIDLMEVSRLIYNGSIADILEMNKLVYGIGNNPWSWKKSFIPLQDTIGLIMNGGQFVIESIKYDGVFYVIKSRRK